MNLTPNRRQFLMSVMAALAAPKALALEAPPSLIPVDKIVKVSPVSIPIWVTVMPVSEMELRIFEFYLWRWTQVHGTSAEGEDRIFIETIASTIARNIRAMNPEFQLSFLSQFEFYDPMPYQQEKYRALGAIPTSQLLRYDVSLKKPEPLKHIEITVTCET